MGYASQHYSKYESEVKWVTASFKKSLQNGVLLSGTPTITDCTGELYFSNIKINDETLTIAADTEHEEIISSGEAVQFLVASGSYTTNYYEMEIQCSTDSVSAPSQTLINIAPIKVIRK